jgi:hypothetical protein
MEMIAAGGDEEGQRAELRDEKEGRERAYEKAGQTQAQGKSAQQQGNNELITQPHTSRIEASIQPRLCGSPPSLPPSYKLRCMLPPSQRPPLPTCHRASMRGSIGSMSME